MESQSREQRSKQMDKNPCYIESTKSLNCLNGSNNNQDECKNEISNYKACKKFWYDIYNFRRLNNIRPFMPDTEDRSKIKKKYLENKNLAEACDHMLVEHKNKTNSF